MKGEGGGEGEGQSSSSANTTVKCGEFDSRRVRRWVGERVAIDSMLLLFSERVEIRFRFFFNRVCNE